MNWKNNIDEGFNRISLVIGIFLALISGFLSYAITKGSILHVIFFILLGFCLGYGLISLLGWIVNGFIGKK